MANALTGIGPVAESLKQTNAGLLNLAGLLQMVQASKAETNRKAQEAANRQAQKDQDALLKVAATHGPVAASKFQADKQLNKEAGRPGILSEDTIASLTSEAAKNKGQTLTPIPEEFTPEWATKFGVKYVPDTNIVTDPKTGKVLTHEDGTPILTPKKSGEAGVRAALDVALAELRKTQSKLDAQEAETLAQNNFIREGKIILTKNALGQPDRVLSAVKLMFDVEVLGPSKTKMLVLPLWMLGYKVNPLGHFLLHGKKEQMQRGVAQ